MELNELEDKVKELENKIYLQMFENLTAQTRSIRNIQSNVQFFFWITITGIVSQILIYVYLTK